MAEAAMKKKAGIEDPFNHGLNSMLSDSSEAPQQILAMEGIQSGDLDSILLSSIPGLEGIGGDLTLADVAELSLEEIEEIMATLEEGNDEFDNVAENMMNIEDIRH